MPKYEECKHIKRESPKNVADENLVREIGENYRTLPTFEKGLYERLYVRHYSIHRNELLRCRWAAYKDNAASKVLEPFQFPNIRHLHFHNGAIRYLPSETIHEKSTHRMKLQPGPGVDGYGPKPIPQEFLQRGSKQEKSAKPDKSRKIKSAKKRIGKLK